VVLIARDINERKRLAEMEKRAAQPAEAD
jgi:hypothetical protein